MTVPPRGIRGHMATTHPGTSPASRRNRMTRPGPFSAGLLLLGLLATFARGAGGIRAESRTPQEAADAEQTLSGTEGRPGRYAVTVTNITRGQTFTPIIVATHRAGIRLF